MNPHLFIVEPYLNGVRIDSFLAKHLRNYTSWRLHRMVAAGLVTVNDLQATTDQRIQSGQRIAIHLAEPPDKLLPAAPLDLAIVYEDPWLLVIDKPVGLVAHPVGDFQEGTLSNAVQHHLDQHSAVRGLLRPGIVHRLDRMTSGLIVVTKDHLSHRLLSLDFQNGATSKSYVALIDGDPAFNQRTIELPIGRRSGNNSVLMSAAPDAGSPRAARTDVTVTDRFGTHAVVKCRLHTGRNHQIRVHLAEIGHPVLGDEFYGPNGTVRKTARFDGGRPTQNRHALHASRLGFCHPILKVRIEFTSRPPADFWKLASRRNSATASGTVNPESGDEESRLRCGS